MICEMVAILGKYGSTVEEITSVDVYCHIDFRIPKFGYELVMVDKILGKEIDI